MAELIAENDDISIFWSPGKGVAALVVMGHMLNHTRSQYWAQNPIEKICIPCIGIAAKRPHWYPPRSMQGGLEIIRQKLSSFERRIGYGFSMGAFGILAHGHDLDLTDALAFSPQWSISPEFVAGTDDRYRQFFDVSLNLGHRANVAPGVRAAIFYDPLMPIDAWSASQIDRNRRAVHVSVKGAGRQTIEAMNATERLERLLARTIQRDYRGIEQDLRIWKKDITTYKASLAARLIRSGRHALASRLLDEILAKEPSNAIAARLSRVVVR